MQTKEERKAYNKRHYAKNKDKLLAYRKKYYSENKEKVAADVKKWQNANPEKVASSTIASSAKQVENLTDAYVSSKLARLKGIHQTAMQLRQYPEIIDCYRAILKLRRICRIKNKQKNYEC